MAFELTLDRIEITDPEEIELSLPAGSVPLEFVNQSGKLFLWYEKAGEPQVAVYKFKLVARGELTLPSYGFLNIVHLGRYFAAYQI